VQRRRWFLANGKLNLEVWDLHLIYIYNIYIYRNVERLRTADDCWWFVASFNALDSEFTALKNWCLDVNHQFPQPPRKRDYDWVYHGDHSSSNAYGPKWGVQWATQH
jgi:hypothetical protein